MRSVLAVVCPPLAVLATGNLSQAAVNAILTMFLFVPGVIHAWSVVERHQTEKRNEALLRAVQAYHT